MALVNITLLTTVDGYKYVNIASTTPLGLTIQDTHQLGVGQYQVVLNALQISIYKDGLSVFREDATNMTGTGFILSDPASVKFAAIQNMFFESNSVGASSVESAEESLRLNLNFVKTTTLNKTTPFVVANLDVYGLKLINRNTMDVWVRFVTALGNDDLLLFPRSEWFPPKGTVKLYSGVTQVEINRLEDFSNVNNVPFPIQAYLYY